MNMRGFMLGVSLFTIAHCSHAWVMEKDFESGSPGLKASGLSGSGFTGSSTAVYDTSRVLNGKYAGKTSINAGATAFGAFGGELRFPEALKKGDQVWVRINTYFPTGFSFAANPFLKFMRIHTTSSSGSNTGY